MGWILWDSNPGRSKRFFSKTPASYSVDTGVFSPKDKVAGSWSWPLTSICLHGVDRATSAFIKNVVIVSCNQHILKTGVTTTLTIYNETVTKVTLLCTNHLYAQYIQIIFKGPIKLPFEWVMWAPSLRSKVSRLWS
jgi:hypothetical protein